MTKQLQSHMNIAAIVLAAGASRRLGTPKQLLIDAAGEALVHLAAREALETGISEVFVVVGSGPDRVQDAVGDLRVHVVENDDWQSGLASSIGCGVREAMAVTTVEAVLLVTCDMPTVGPRHLRALIHAFESGKARVASAYGDTIGIPAIISRVDFAGLLTLTGDKGAKELLMHEDTARIELDHGTFDIDTPEDVQAWRASFH